MSGHSDPDDEDTQVFKTPFVSMAEQTRSLLVFHHDGVDVVSLIPNVPVTIGRAIDADVVFRGAQLSRRHARFELSEGVVWVEDLRSTNGTLVNGAPIREPARLLVGDEVRLGTVVIRVTGAAATDGRTHGLDKHDHFVAALEDELVRARRFQRNTALILVHASGGGGEELHRWAPGVKDLIRDVDRIGLYGPQILEICQVEAGVWEAQRMAEEIVRQQAHRGPALHCGIAVYPEAGRTVDALFAAAHEAIRSTTSAEPVQVAAASRQSTLVHPEADEGGSERVVRSPAMLALYQTADRVAAASIPILVLGETGTGKEVLAHYIHSRSRRARMPLHCINCGAIPENLVESVLFGHERGAFTGAVQRQQGAFEAASGSTILLDEIGELPLPAQAALLRVLETGRVNRVGSHQEIEVDVRVIAATNRDLEAMVREGRFREDLLYRINAMTLHIPPLRERLSDIPALANLFIDQLAFEHGRNVMGISAKALSRLLRYHWPGNVRELRNVIQRAVLIAMSDRIEPADLPERLRDSRPQVEEEPEDDPVDDPAEPDTIRTFLDREQISKNFKHAIRACETTLIRQALVRANGSQRQAADILALPRRTLSYKVHNYGIDHTRPDPAASSVLARLSDPEDKGLDFRERIERIEARLIRSALERNDGDQALAARELGLHPRTVAAKVQKYGL